MRGRARCETGSSKFEEGANAAERFVRDDRLCSLSPFFTRSIHCWVPLPSHLGPSTLTSHPHVAIAFGLPDPGLPYLPCSSRFPVHVHDDELWPRRDTLGVRQQTWQTA